MSRRTVTVLVVAGVVAAAAGATIWLAAREPGGETAAEGVPHTLAPDEIKAQACDYVLQTLPQQVADDVPAEQVRTDLRRARSLAQAAADRDASWVALASGMTTLQRAVEADDAGATDLALRVVSAECAQP